LRETQSELLQLVETHEKLTKKQSLKSQDILILTSDINKLKEDILKKKTLLVDCESRLLHKEDEIRKIKDRLCHTDSR